MYFHISIILYDKKMDIIAIQQTSQSTDWKYVVYVVIKQTNK